MTAAAWYATRVGDVAAIVVGAVCCVFVAGIFLRPFRGRR